MRKTFLLSQVLIITILFSITACAESPTSPVATTNPNNTLSDEPPHTGESETITLALKYKGRDTQGRTCDLYVSFPREDHKNHGHEHEHALLMKVDYTTLDGHRPHAGKAHFYLYDNNTGFYYDEDSNQADTILSLLSLSMKDPSITPDINSINEYLTHAELEQYLRVEFSQNTNAFAFEQALHKVLDGDVSINDKLNVFSSVQFISLATAHGDHYHFPACMNFKPVRVEETTFNLEGHGHAEEESHEHDHNHDH